MNGAASPRDELARRFSWTALLGVTVGLLFFAPFFERPGGERLPGETTALMAAQSLALDGDLRYTRNDYDRHLLTWLREPPELALASASGGRHLAYAVSPAYSVWLAPFVRFWPQQGFAIANCLLLLLVSLGVAAHWQRVRGVFGPLLLGVCLFGSLLIGAPFVADGGLFAALATLAAFTLLQASSSVERTAPEAAEPPRRGGAAPWIAGGLLAVSTSGAWIHGWLLVAGLAMVSGRRRGPLLAGWALALLVLLAVPWYAAGGLHGDGSGYQVQVVAPSSGFPEVDFEGQQWARVAVAPETTTVVSPSLSLSAWALVDRLFGRSLGIVPCFPILLPLLWGARRQRRRRPMVWATAAWLVTGAVALATDLEMGGAAWAAGLWLPVYAGWVATLGWVSAVGRQGSAVAPRRWPTWLAWGMAGVVALCILPEAWRAPWRAPLVWTSEEPRAGLRSRLPLELSQTEVLVGDRLSADDITWLTLDDRGWVETRRRRLLLPGQPPSHWLLASAEPLSPEVLAGLPESIGWQLAGPWDDGAADDSPVAGPQVTAGGTVAPVPEVVSSGWRRHRVWWTPSPRWLYRVRWTPGLPAAEAGASDSWILRPSPAAGERLGPVDAVALE